MRGLWQLSWSELDPIGRTVDVDLIPALAGQVAPTGGRWYERMTEALVDGLGPWAAGWAHTVAIERGRPIWRIHPPRERTTDAVIEAVVIWHELLTEIATDSRGRFAGLPVAEGRRAGGGPRAWQALNNSPAPDVHPRWADFDPAGRSFDAGSLPTVAYDLLLTGDREWVVTAGLVKRYGTWVSHWSTPRDSPLTVEVITAGVARWHAWLVELARRFAEFQPLTEDHPDNFERAARYLITAAAEYEDYALDWHHRCETVFRWLLEVSEVPARRHSLLIDFSLDSRFDYMSRLDPAYVDRVAEDFALYVAALPDYPTWDPPG